MIIIYYDDQCSLCSKEIRHYQKISPSGIFDWRGISNSTKELKKAGISLSDSLKLLHAVDNANQIHRGVDAFVLIWSQLKRWNILAFIIQLPIIKSIANIAYTRFAGWRFERLSHCRLPDKKK